MKNLKYQHYCSECLTQFSSNTESDICPGCNSKTIGLINEETSTNETLEEVAEKYAESIIPVSPVRKKEAIKYFIAGYKHCEKTMYSEEELHTICLKMMCLFGEHVAKTITGNNIEMVGELMKINTTIEKWFNNNKK